MTSIDMCFKNDLRRPHFVRHHIIRSDQALQIYDCILDHTDNHELASEVSGWVDLAGIDEEYDTDEIHAVIVEN